MVIVIVPNPAMVRVPITRGDEPMMVAIIITGHHDGCLTNRRGDYNLRRGTNRRRNHDRRWRSDHQPGREKQRETEP
jgi:hypothetical protein